MRTWSVLSSALLVRLARPQRNVRKHAHMQTRALDATNQKIISGERALFEHGCKSSHNLLINEIHPCNAAFTVALRPGHNSRRSGMKESMVAGIRWSDFTSNIFGSPSILHSRCQRYHGVAMALHPFSDSCRSLASDFQQISRLWICVVRP